MYKKILVPLDGSEFSECALNDVKILTSESKNTEVILLRVLEPLPEYYMSRRIGEEFRRKAIESAEADAKDYLTKRANGLKKDGLTVKTAVASGKPADEIMKYALKNKVELIVMTTHGRSGPSRLAFGSVAEKVIRNAQIPVLSITPPGCRLTD